MLINIYENERKILLFKIYGKDKQQKKKKKKKKIKLIKDIIQKNSLNPREIIHNNRCH